LELYQGGRYLEQLRRGCPLRRSEAGEEVHRPQGWCLPHLEGGPAIDAGCCATGGQRRAGNGGDGEGEPTATKKAAKGAKSAKAGKAERKHKAADGAGRDGSKKATVLALLKKPGGVTLKEIMAATDWQAHSVRGFISGALGKKMGLTVESTRREDGERSYRLA
jgi:hypothetical protein